MPKVVEWKLDWLSRQVEAHYLVLQLEAPLRDSPEWAVWRWWTAPAVPEHALAGYVVSEVLGSPYG
jgi:hypothetical protein